MAFALARTAGGMHRLAQAGVGCSLLMTDWAQPGGIATGLLAWHGHSTTNCRKMFSSEDKQGRPHIAAQDQADASKQSGSDKPQQAGAHRAVDKIVVEDAPSLLRLFTQPLLSISGSLAVWTVKQHVETTFDEQEFLEGAKDAWFAVHTCMNSQDYEKLQDMCTPALMTVVRQVFLEHHAQNKSYEVTDVHVQHAQLAAASFLLPNGPPLAAAGEGAAGVAAPSSSEAALRSAPWSQWAVNLAKGALGGYSLAMWVRFSGCLTRQLVKDKDGNVMSEMEDRRSHSWLFVRGPLPDKLPVQVLDAPWQLMGFH